MSPKFENNTVVDFAAVKWLEMRMKNNFSTESSSKVWPKNKTSNFEVSDVQIRTDSQGQRSPQINNWGLKGKSGFQFYLDLKWWNQTGLHLPAGLFWLVFYSRSSKGLESAGCCLVYKMVKLNKAETQSAKTFLLNRKLHYRHQEFITYAACRQKNHIWWVDILSGLSVLPEGCTKEKFSGNILHSMDIF